MRAILLFSLGALLLGTVLMNLIRADSGYILISIGSKTIESGFWFGITAVIFLIILAWLALKLLKKILTSVGWSFAWWAESRSKKSQQRLEDGLIHFIEGDWTTAKKELLKASKGADKPLIHFLAAAYSACKLGDAEEALQLLSRAEQSTSKKTLAVTLGRARAQLLIQKYPQCLATLERARAGAPKHPAVLDLIKQVNLHTQDWDALVKILPELRNTGLYSEKELGEIEEKVYTEILLLSSQSENSEHIESELESTWKTLPAFSRSNPRLVVTYARLLLNHKLDDAAEVLISDFLQKQWDDELIDLYAEVKSSRWKQQLSTAEKWLKKQPKNAHLFYSLGKICKRNELWGKAKEYFEDSLKLEERPEIFAELASLQAVLGETEKSAELYQRGLLLTTK